ncbi:MAG TPA: hypothetical protein VE567_01145, partial [Sphingomonas sp.]|nr:hypothetical protein [Sphingomonas sp.]
MRLNAALIALAVSACSGPAEKAQSATPPVSPKPMLIGVSTHFGQGWPERYWTTLGSVPAPLVRDSVSWKSIETIPGQYSFTGATVGHVRRLCATGHRAVLVLLPKHPAYDGNFTVYSLAGRTAFGSYVAALAREFGTCLAGVQIGNEINGPGNVTGPAATDRPASYTAILQAVHAALANMSPRPLILGGSTNTIGTGFLEQVFKAGALDYMDAVVVHPYRKDPANVDWELGLLREAMARHGAVKPIWANEFSIDTTDTVAAADYLAKMLVQLSAAGVEAGFWYALVD